MPNDIEFSVYAIGSDLTERYIGTVDGACYEEAAAYADELYGRSTSGVHLKRNCSACRCEMVAVSGGTGICEPCGGIERA
jgi:hypothetical protein